jgi:hypothetical protein
MAAISGGTSEDCIAEIPPAGWRRTLGGLDRGAGPAGGGAVTVQPAWKHRAGGGRHTDAVEELKNTFELAERSSPGIQCRCSRRATPSQRRTRALGPSLRRPTLPPTLAWPLHSSAWPLSLRPCPALPIKFPAEEPAPVPVVGPGLAEQAMELRREECRLMGRGRGRGGAGRPGGYYVDQAEAKAAPAAQQKCRIMVTSVVAHIYGLNFEDGRVRDLAQLFNAKVQKVVEDTTQKLRVVEHLQELAQEAEYFAFWLDCDREGENIIFEVISLCNEWINYDNVYRARLSALTGPELGTAFDNLVRPDKYAAMCVDARQEMDLKIGVAFSHLMTKAFLEMAREKFRLRDQKVVSFGPCQTPTPWFCVQRHKEIQHFVTILAMQADREVGLVWADGDRVTDRSGQHDKSYLCRLQMVFVGRPELARMEAAVRAATREQSAAVVRMEEERKVHKRPIGLNTVMLQCSVQCSVQCSAVQCSATTIAGDPAEGVQRRAWDVAHHRHGCGRAPLQQRIHLIPEVQGLLQGHLVHDQPDQYQLEYIDNCSEEYSQFPSAE